MENDVRKCPHDCARCTFRQNVYCSSQLALATFESTRRIEELLGQIVSSLSEPPIEHDAQDEEAVQIIDSSKPKNKK